VNDYQKLIDEYTEDYCLFLEATYSKGMMSEGGTDAIDLMFSDINVQNKKLLDIGFGLGGAPFHLAEKHQTRVTGIELNPWMTEEARRRTPQHLKKLVDFVNYENPPHLPFPNDYFDLIYSKGVLTHVNDKLPLFKEIFRALKPGEIFLIDDWLSPTSKQWGAGLQKMCEIENLTLYAFTEKEYIELLQKTGFSHIEIRDENLQYAKYNQDVIKHLNSPDYSKKFIQRFSKEAWKEAIECYQLIADSIKDNELLVRRIRCIKQT
jgi:ubiquinone/menaquinone biosynthesis C-methylase UbiE